MNQSQAYAELQSKQERIGKRGLWREVLGGDYSGRISSPFQIIHPGGRLLSLSPISGCHVTPLQPIIPFRLLLLYLVPFFDHHGVPCLQCWLRAIHLSAGSQLQARALIVALFKDSQEV